MYSLHVAGVDVCSNELEGVAFTSSRNFMQGVGPLRGDHALQ